MKIISCLFAILFVQAVLASDTERPWPNRDLADLLSKAIDYVVSSANTRNAKFQGSDQLGKKCSMEFLVSSDQQSLQVNIDSDASTIGYFLSHQDKQIVLSESGVNGPGDLLHLVTKWPNGNMTYIRLEKVNLNLWNTYWTSLQNGQKLSGACFEHRRAHY